MSDITLAFILTGVGLATVFAVLLLFYVSISILMRVFRNKVAAQKGGAHKD